MASKAELKLAGTGLNMEAFNSAEGEAVRKNCMSSGGYHVIEDGGGYDLMHAERGPSGGTGRNIMMIIVFWQGEL